MIKKYRVPVMLGKLSSQSYKKLSLYLKFKYNTHQIDKLLDNLFTQLHNEEINSVTTLPASQKRYKSLEFYEKKVVFYINERWNIDEWTDQHKESIKIEKNKIDNIIKEVYDIKGVSKVNHIRNSILSKIQFKLKRIGKYSYYIVHDTFIDNQENYNKYMSQLDKFHSILKLLKVKGRLSTDELVELVDKDKDLALMLNRSNRLRSIKDYVVYVHE